MEATTRQRRGPSSASAAFAAAARAPHRHKLMAPLLFLALLQVVTFLNLLGSSQSSITKNGAVLWESFSLPSSAHNLFPQEHKDVAHKDHGRTKRGRLLLDYDVAGIQAIPGSSRSHRLPNAIPEVRSIPRDYAEDFEYHLSQRRNTTSYSRTGYSPKSDYNWAHNYSQDFRTLYQYNPSVLPLHNTVNSTDDDDDPDYLSQSDLEALTGGDPRVRYLVSYHVYTGTNCFGPDPERVLMKAGERIFYVAMALLDENLDLIEGTDVLFDLNVGPGFGRYGRQFRADCRLHLLRGDIYMMCNDQLHRVRVVRRTTGTSNLNATNYGTGDNHRLPYLYENIYGNGLQVILRSHYYKMGGGKNFHIFRSRVGPHNQQKNSKRLSTGPYDYYIQIFPHPHEFRQVFIPSHEQEELNVYPKRRGWDDTVQKSQHPLPEPSFDTPDALHTILRCENVTENCAKPKEVPFFPEQERGTACCITLELNGTSVLVGISHNKLSPTSNFWMLDVYRRYDHLLKDQYVSRFVAYQTEPPFDIVARSGYFCLGPGQVGEHSLAGRNLNVKLNLFNQSFECPPIHFPSTLSEYVGDSSKAIIGYGINDCYPRIMVVHKEDIVKRFLGVL